MKFKRPNSMLFVFSTILILLIVMSFSTGKASGTTLAPLVIPKTDSQGTIVSFQFNPDYRNSNGNQSAQYQYYGNTVFYKVMYKPTNDPNHDQYLIFIPYDPSTHISVSQFDFGKIYENHTTIFSGGPYMAPVGNPNLDRGASTPNLHDYLGDESGSMSVLYNGSVHHWEYRFMGYNEMGTPMNNPSFPADGYAQEWWYPWQMYDWFVNFPDASFTGQKIPRSPYAGTQTADGWWKNTVFPMPGQRFEDYTNYGQDPLSFWKTRMEFENDPTQSAGILVGFFSSGAYDTYVLPSQPMPNLRMMDFKIMDDQGNVLAEATRGDDPIGTLKTTINNQYVTKGTTYHLEAVVKNMTPPNHPTTYTPVSVDALYAYDSNANVANTYDNEDTGITDINNLTSIPAGGTATIKWNYPIPTTISQYIKMGAVIPSGFFTAGDNYYPDDDKSEIKLQVQPEDIAVTDVELVDQNNNTVSSPVANQLYKLVFTVTKPVGSTPIDNATLDVTYTDGNSTVSKKASATQTLQPNGQIQIVVNNVSSSTGYLKATGTIDPMYQSEGLDSNLSNDTVSKTWRETINYSVNNLVITPGSVALPYGQYSGRQDLTFNVVANLAVSDSNDKTPRTVPIVLSSNGRVLASQMITIPPNTPMPVTFTIPSYYIYLGTIPFQVEINPNPGRQMEYKNDGSDPYADNITKTTLPVIQSTQEYKCSEIHTQNNWTTRYQIYYWSGGYWQWVSTKYGGYYYCVRWINYRVQYFSGWETFKITHIYFKSHTTGDNWVDLLNSTSTSTPGLIKSGYGFQFEVTTNYQTDLNSAPVSWGGCYAGQWVYPYTPQTYVPNTITVKWPWNNTSNQPYVQMLYGSQSGSWYDETTTYTLPYRNAFGITTVPEYFVSINTNDGFYPITVTTNPYFRGNDVKFDSWYTSPYYFPNLCDSQTVYIHVNGSMYDDLRTQLLQ